MGRLMSLPLKFHKILAATLFACALGALAAAGNTPADVMDLAGHAFDPFQAAAGTPVVLIFVRTDCPIANRYAPEIQRLSLEHQGKAKFFLVYVDKKESSEAIRKHDQDYKYRLTAVRDLQHSLVRQSLAQITPEAAVFDAKHRLIYHGRIDNLYEDFGHTRKSATTHELDAAIRAAITGKPLPLTSVPAVGCYISDVE
jgi:hypothetical protein